MGDLIRPLGGMMDRPLQYTPPHSLRIAWLVPVTGTAPGTQRRRRHQRLVQGAAFRNLEGLFNQS